MVTRLSTKNGNIHLCVACDETLTGKRHWRKERENGVLHANDFTTGHHLHPNDYFRAVEKESCWACNALRAQVSEKQYEALKAFGPTWNSTDSEPAYFTWISMIDGSDPAVVGPRGSFEFHLMFGGDARKRIQEVGRQSKWNVISPTLYLWAQSAASMFC